MCHTNSGFMKRKLHTPTSIFLFQKDTKNKKQKQRQKKNLNAFHPLLSMWLYYRHSFITTAEQIHYSMAHFSNHMVLDTFNKKKN